MEALVELPGVGRKTANVVLGHALGVPGPTGRSPRPACFEPHRHRPVRRSGGRRGAAVRGAFTGRLDAHVDTLILHGRRICKPRPLCERCAIRRTATTTATSCEGAIRAGAAPSRRRARDPVGSAARSAAPQAAGEGARTNGIRFESVSSSSSRQPCGTSLVAFAARCRTSRSSSKTTSARNPRRYRHRSADTLFGLYQGTPLTERSWTTATPCRIGFQSTSGHRRGLRRRRGDPGLRRRDRHPRVRSLLRDERGRDRGDRGKVLARRVATR